MAYDGHIRIGVELDTAALSKELDNLGRLARGGSASAQAAVSTLLLTVTAAGAAIIAATRQAVVEARRQADAQARDGGFQQVGAHMAAGVKAGLNAGVGAVVAAGRGLVRSVLTGMRQEAQIASPSKVMRDIVGKNLALGVAVGITENETEAVKAARKLAADVFDAASEWIDTEAYFDRLDTRGQIEAYRALQSVFVEGSAERKRIDRELYALEQQLLDQSDKQRAAAYDADKQRVDDQARYGNASLVEQYNAWLAVMGKYKAGTKERTAAERELLDVVTAIGDEVDRLNATYDVALDKRTGELMNTYGLFEFPDVHVRMTPTRMTANLGRQVSQLQAWSDNMKLLAGRGLLDPSLMAELTALGPEYGREVETMLAMSDGALKDYNTLYTEKRRLAAAQAKAELAPLRDELNEQIKALTIADIDRDGLHFVGDAIMKAIADGAKNGTPSLLAVIRDALAEIVADANDALGNDADPTATFLPGYSGFTPLDYKPRSFGKLSRAQQALEELRLVRERATGSGGSINANLVIEASGSLRRIIELLGLELKRADYLGGGQ